MSKYNSNGLSQHDLMIKDECITLDHDDNVIGTASKKDAHIFNKESPRGILHRAFSVFLFNSKNELLLQQRASSKITFPDVWTNTCCSHPLSGFTPNEIDYPENVANGAVPGVKAAAIRKLEHELGIPANSLSISQFKFLTRLHYWAADVVTHGKSASWGEHEIDYILFIKADIQVHPNPEEVKDTKYVTHSQLKEMMSPSSGLLWSPWFRIIAEQFLVHWWADLDHTLNTNAFVDTKSIYRFDPTSEHMGGAGNAQEWLGKASYKVDSNSKNKSTATATAGNNKNLKQGAYGKVKIHKHSKLDQLSRIDEIFSALYFKVMGMPNNILLKDSNIKFCDDMLIKVSRSFSAVIHQLPSGLCVEIMIFYLALRALDTIEDDMEAFKGKEHIKIDWLNNFYRTGLVTDGWSMDGVGEADEKVLLQQYHRCVSVFKSLSPSSQEIIADITKRMGHGMASYVEKDLGQGTVTIKDYNEYCHYVAGLVGEGLSRLFTSCGYETESVASVSKTLANTMGLFLQKNNIIRDYLEDYVDGRAFWPQEVWKQYTKTGNLGELADPKCINQATACLNHLVTDALECVPECLEYMDLLQTEEVFRFCAIPQVMAIAGLSELYNNRKVFTGVVKIRKGMTCKLILDTVSHAALHKWMYILTLDILKRIPKNDPNANKTKEICKRIISITETKARASIIEGYCNVIQVLSPLLLILSTYVLYGNNLFDTVIVDDTISIKSLSLALRVMRYDHLVAVVVGIASILYIFFYSIVAATRKRSLKRAD